MIGGKGSPLETAFAKMPVGHRLVAGRFEHYDQDVSLLYAPVEYTYEKIDDASDEMPDSSWVCEAFWSFVRGEFGTGAGSKGKCLERPPIREPEIVSDDIIFKYLECCENDLVYGGLALGLIRGAGPKMGDQIYSLITDQRLGNRLNAKHMSLREFTAKVELLNKKEARLQFVLPSFPFKDQNIFRTQCEPYHVDMAEIALLIRLHVLSLAIYQAHPYGADWIIASDGSAYSSIFGVNESEILAYKTKLVEYRNRLNLQRTVTIVDLKELATGLGSAKRGNNIFEETKDYIRNTLEQEISRGTSDLFLTLRVLVRGMKWNINYKEMIISKSLSWEDSWLIITTEDRTSVPTHLLECWEEFDQIAVNAALEYASFNLALKYHNIYDKYLPNSIRATIHPKLGQVAVPSLGATYPWNGVGVLIDSSVKTSSFECWELRKLMSKKPNFKPCILPGTKNPLYYDATN